MNDILTDAPEPSHLFDHEIEYGSYDAEYVITFICKYNIQPAIDLQLKASEDELVQRIREITAENFSQNYLTNLGKLIVAYAQFQDRQYDTNFQNNWQPGDRVQPVDELLDLRTQIDIRKRKERFVPYTYSYRPYVNHQLRKGIQNRKYRIKERNRYQYGTTFNRQNPPDVQPIPTPRQTRATASTTTKPQTSKQDNEKKKVDPIRIKRERRTPTPEREDSSKRSEYTWRIYGNKDKRRMRRSSTPIREQINRHRNKGKN